ncbi:hypothetical protein R69919_04200 [Paraburkholderia gardini]|nr:hypothetical protein R69919_04200 [Paraburkholderia gardini]
MYGPILYTEFALQRPTSRYSRDMGHQQEVGSSQLHPSIPPLDLTGLLVLWPLAVCS